jgi:hypothetical protein
MESESVIFQKTILAVLVYIVLVKVVPRVITQNTGFFIIDDIVKLLKSQKDSLVSGAIITALVAFTSEELLKRYLKSVIKPIE